MNKGFFKIVFKSLKERQLRSWLTAVGIVISVASIVALISISNGLQGAIKDQFEQMGTNRLYVMAKGGDPATTTGLTKEDSELLEKMWEFEYVTPFLMEPAAKVKFSNEEQYRSVMGFPSDDADKRWESYGIGFSEGGMFREGQKNVAVVGYLIAKDIFDKEIRLKNSIYINDRKFQVIGIIEEIGNEQDDTTIYIPMETARELFEKPTEVSFIDATIKEGVDLYETSDKAKRKLERKRGAEDLEILTPEEILKFLDQALALVRGILVSIASISLIVGCVGILNSMYTSVLERTKDIGIMKSVGATNRSIMLLFLIEAGMIGLVGGVIGVIFGMLVSFGVGKAAALAGFKLLKIEWDFMLMFGGLCFAVLVGMFSGVLPARQASKLHPVDALRW